MLRKKLLILIATFSLSTYHAPTRAIGIGGNGHTTLELVMCGAKVAGYCLIAFSIYLASSERVIVRNLGHLGLLVVPYYGVTHFMDA